MNTTELKEFVQLGQAAYADFSSGVASFALTNSLNGQFSQGEADQFLQRYSILNQYTSSGLDGFSASVFLDKNNLTFWARRSKFSSYCISYCNVISDLFGSYGTVRKRKKP